MPWVWNAWQNVAPAPAPVGGLMTDEFDRKAFLPSACSISPMVAARCMQYVAGATARSFRSEKGNICRHVLQCPRQAQGCFGIRLELLKMRQAAHGDRIDNVRHDGIHPDDVTAISLGYRSYRTEEPSLGGCVSGFAWDCPDKHVKRC